jgi:predicted nuclease of predicted toxin-antitoxin system
MKFLMDEHIEPAITRGLRRIYPQLDILSVQEAGLRTQPDEVILTWAAQEGRVVVSRDVNTMTDEAARRIDSGLPMAGLLLIRPSFGYGEIIKALQLFVECAEEGELEGVIDFIPI